MIFAFGATMQAVICQKSYLLDSLAMSHTTNQNEN
jgi:hypothetical protein